MRPSPFWSGLILLFLALPACRVVKNEPPSATSVAADDPISALVDQTFDAQLLPLITSKALPVAQLRGTIAADFDGTGAAHGNRGAGQGAAWNFAVTGEGTVVSANLTSRARKAEIDTDGDGVADLTLLLGPVIAGTTLRDIAPFYAFGSFKDQIEFAQLARALNDKVSPLLVLPEGDITASKIRFMGALALKSAAEPFVVTAVNVEILQ